MLEVVLSVFVLCLAVIGLIEIFRAVSLFFLDKKNSTITLIPICGHVEDIEMVLRNAMSSAQWLGNKGAQRIICLDLGVDEETRDICEIFRDEYELVELYSLEEFSAVMQQSVV